MIDLDQYTLIDLKNNFDQVIYDKWVIYLRYIIENDDHPLIKNYINLHESLNEYLCFNIILDKNDEIAMFSGLWNHEVYPSNSARVLNRLYVDKKYRNTAMISSRSIKHINRMYSSKIILPYQIEYAKNSGLEIVFWSMENLHRRKQVKMLMDSQNKILDGYQFELLDGLYNTCRKYKINNKLSINDQVGCWHNIVILKLIDGAVLNLPFKNI